MNAAIDEAFAGVVAAMDLELEAVVRDPNAFADQGFVDQDIVDTERFVKSQLVDVRNRKATFRWVAKDPTTGQAYPIALYTGFRAFGKGKYIPGRRWPEKAADRLDIPETMKGSLAERGIKSRVKIKRKVYS